MKESINSARRRFFRSLLVETLSIAEEVKGKPQMLIDDLDSVPDPLFETIVPAPHDSRLHRIEGNRLLRLDRKSGLQELVHEFNEREISVISRFDGTHTIRQIVDELSDKTGEEWQDCYRRVKLLFILLARRMVFLPSSAHER